MDETRALRGSLAAGAVLVATGPTPAAAVRALVEPPPGDPTGALLAAVALVAQALAAWLLLTAVLTAGGRLPGLLGRACRGAAARTAPAALRRAVALGLGLGVVVAPSGVAAADAPVPPPRPALAADLDWPGLERDPARPVDTVVVRRGDTLWGIAAAHLPSTASDARVAAAWPAWYAANRGVIGNDPDLVRPGQRLSPPS